MYRYNIHIYIYNIYNIYINIYNIYNVYIYIYIYIYFRFILFFEIKQNENHENCRKLTKRLK